MGYLETLDKLLNKLELDGRIQNVAEDIYLLKPEAKFEKAPAIAITAITHGDEIIGLPIFIKLLESYLADRLSILGPLYLIIANRTAHLKNQRYVESDLNRSYGYSNLKTVEGQRAQVIKAIIDRCDYSIDIHQCIENTLTPFFILPYSSNSLKWANQVAPEIPVIIRKSIKTATTLSSYAFLKKKYALTFEVGSRGVDEKQMQIGMKTIIKFLLYAWDQFIQATPYTKKTSTYEIAYFQPYDYGQVRFARDYTNFETVHQHQLIAYLNKEKIYSPITGKLLLYPKHWFLENSTVKPDGIFSILQVVD